MSSVIERMNDRMFRFGADLGGDRQGYVGEVFATVVAEKLGGADHVVSVVGKHGEVLKDEEGRYIRFTVRDEGRSGAKVFMDFGNGPDAVSVTPGETHTIPVGDIWIRVNGTDTNGVRFHGHPVRQDADKSQSIRYPLK